MKKSTSILPIVTVAPAKSKGKKVTLDEVFEKYWHDEKLGLCRSRGAYDYTFDGTTNKKLAETFPSSCKSGY